MVHPADEKQISIWDCFPCSQKKRHERQKEKWQKQYSQHVRVQSKADSILIDQSKEEEHKKLKEKHIKFQLETKPIVYR